MTDLSAFDDEANGSDLSGFNDSSPAPFSTEPSDKNVAAQGAVMDGVTESLIETYQTLSELPSSERTAAMGNITDRVHQSSVDKSRNIAAQLVMNPDISEEEANSIVRAMAGMPEDKPSSNQLMAMEAGMRPSGDEGKEQEDIRIDAAEISRQIVERMELKQQILNGKELSTNTGGLNAVADFLDLVIPFSEGILTADVVNQVRGGDKLAASKALALLGSVKMDMKEAFQQMDWREQGVVIESLAKIIDNSSTLIFTNDNDLAQRDLFMSIVDGSYYGDGDKALDNIISVLDLVGLGALLRVPKAAVKATGMTRKLGRRAMRSKEQPTAPAKIIGEVNPEEARQLHAMADADESGEAASTIYGTTREEAIVSAKGPQVDAGDGSVENKVHDLDKYVRELTERDGMIDLSADEIKSAQVAAASRLESVNGVVNRGELATTPEFKPDGTTVFRNVYGPAGGSYKDPQNAIDNVLNSLRNYDVKESDLVLLRKEGDEYVETTLSEVKAKEELREEFVSKKKALPEYLKRINFKQDYLVRVNFEHKADPFDVSWDKLQVKRNFFDHISKFNRGEIGKASLNRYFFDVHSMFDPRITLGANVAVDKSSAIEAALTGLADNFVKPFLDLDVDRQELIYDIIKNQNFMEARLTPTQLKAKGVSEAEMKLLDKWQETWDSIYWLENKDLIKRLRAGKYQLFEDSVSDTRLVAKPVAVNKLDKVGKVYDPQTGTFEVVGPSARTELYANNGTIAKLRQPEVIDGNVVEFIVARNKDGESGLRTIRDSDQILNHTQGYYTVRYKDPHIIEKRYVDASGVERRQAVKTAGDVKTADLAVDNLNRDNVEPGVTYIARSNRDDSVTQMEDDYWSLQATNGRTSQRVRGERLGEVGSNLVENSLGATEGPAEALMNSVRSISRRTGMRDYIERYKQRFINEYGDMLPRDEFNNPIWPRNSDDLKPDGRETSKRMADARANLEYINYLENGYRNGLDDAWKAMLNGMADGLGKFSPAAEGAVRATADEVISPAGWLRARAFDAYLATNPIRQFVVQAHQMSLLAANFTKYVASGKIAKELGAVHHVIIKGADKVKDTDKVWGMSGKEAKQLADEYKLTGFDASIDRQNLVENGLDQLVETTRFKGAKKLHTKTVGTLRKLGFDAGERINIMSSWLAHRNKAIEDGLDISDPRVFEEVMGKARNYTFNMNEAGNLPYNKNAMSLVFQFMQVPHKAILQFTTNRVLSRKERMRLAAYNAVMLPLPVGLVTTLFGEDLPEDPVARDFLINGLEGMLLNQAARAMFGDDTTVDFTSLAAVDPNAPFELINGILTSDIGTILANSPSLSLWAGHNPRMTNIVRETMNLVTAPDDLSMEDLGAVAHTFASFSSGYANLSKSFKELFVQEYAKRYSASGEVVNSNVTTPESIAKLLGFGTLEEALQREVIGSLYSASPDAKKDVRELYRLQTQALARRGINADNPEWSQRMLRAFWIAGDFSGGQKEEYLKLMKRDASKGDAGAMGIVLRNIGYVSADEIRKAIVVGGYSSELSETVDLLERLGGGEE
jgi:hypothetical protein